MDSIHLIGADDVRSAGNTMKHAAENMQSAANSMAEAHDRFLLNFQGMLDQFISELREVVQEVDLATMATPMQGPVTDGHIRVTYKAGNLRTVVEGALWQVEEYERTHRIEITGDDGKVEIIREPPSDDASLKDQIKR